MIYEFILFYNGREYFDNYIIRYNTDTQKWECVEHFPTGFLGNFHPAKMQYTIQNKKYEFPTSENAFQSAKCKKESDIRRFQNISPGDAFKVGRSVDLRNDWENVKVPIMRDILREKFANNTLKQMLLNTKDAYLIEHTHRDKFWADANNGSGRNQLGHLLMQVREEYGGSPKPKIPNEIVKELYKKLDTFN